MAKNLSDNLLDHSKAKVRLLGEYLKRYFAVISNDRYTQRIKIYDLFCGEGLYGRDEGSPLIILQQVKTLHIFNNSKGKSTLPIDCYFNDIDSNKITKLKKVIEDDSLHESKYGDINFSDNDYQIEIAKLNRSLANLKNKKAFVFIDPYGYKEIKASQIKALLQNKKTEVLLWLPTQHMYRFSDNGTPEALKDLIREINEYKEWEKSDSIWKFINLLREGFQRYIGNSSFVDSFTIHKDTNTVFCLFFFTSHIKGFEKMLEAKWEIDAEQGKGWNYSGNVPDLFSDQKTNPLEEKLLEFLKDESRYNGEVYEFTLRQGYLPKHTVQIFESWKNSDRLDVFLQNGSKARGFYIKYHRDSDPDKRKVYFKLK